MATSKSINKKNYLSYINEPKVFFNPVKDVRLFDLTILEMFTKTAWYLIPIFWGPVIIYSFLRSL